MDETQAGIKFAGRNINNLTYADDTTFTAESEEVHVQFLLLLPDLHTDFSRGRSGGLVFPSLSEFSTVLRICQTVIQSVFTILHSHQQCMRIPVSPYPH